MNEERVERQRGAGRGARHAHSRRMRQGIGPADDERFKRAGLVKRRAPVRLDFLHRNGGRRRCREFARGWGLFGLPVDELGRPRGQAAGAHCYRNGLDGPKLTLGNLKKLVGIMRLNPVAQESGRHGDGQLPIAAVFRFHATEPTGVEILAQFGAQALGNIAPTVLQSVPCRIRHICSKPLFYCSIANQRRRFRQNPCVDGISPDPNSHAWNVSNGRSNPAKMPCVPPHRFLGLTRRFAL